MRDAPSRVEYPTLDGDGQDRPIPMIAVGDTREWARTRGTLPASSDVVFVDFDDLTQDYVEALGATLVVSPLVGPGFDCVDVAARLCGMNFKGSYRVLCSELPKPAIVRKEIRTMCPTLDFDIIAPAPTSKIRKI